MGLSNFTTNNDDDNGPGGPGGPGGTGLPPMPPMGPLASGGGLDNLLVNYNERFKSASPLLFRDGIIAQLCATLIGKTKPNAQLIGPAGVGKTALAEELARRIETKDPSIPTRLANSTVYELPLSGLVAGAGIVGQLEERLTEVVDFATDKKNDAIIFIDEIHLLQGDDPTYRKAAQILKPALARGDMRVIGSTTMNEAQDLEKDPAFKRRFTRIIVDELTPEQAHEVLRGALGGFLAHYSHQISVSDDVLGRIVSVADETSSASSHRPDNALTLLDRSMADVVIGRNTAIAKAQAAGDTALVQVLQNAGTIALSEKKIKAVAMRLMTGLAEKEPYDEAKIVTELQSLKGQDRVLDDLVDAMRRDSLGAFPRTKPMTWLLAGPSGVGKTQATKIISKALTGQAPIMLNMGEYHTQWDASKLIGSGPGYVGSDSNKELPFDTLESNPYRVILLDEIEKADKVIHRLFLTAIDEGWMRMANGKIVDFSKAIIVATTNAGRDAMVKPRVGFQMEAEPRPMTRGELTKALSEAFEPEFLGRFGKLVAFDPLGRDTYAEILAAAYAAEVSRIAESDPWLASQIPSGIDGEKLEALVAETYVPEQGARPAESAARRVVEDAVIAVRYPAPAQTPIAIGTPVGGPEEDRADAGEAESAGAGVA